MPVIFLNKGKMPDISGQLECAGELVRNEGYCEIVQNVGINLEHDHAMDFESALNF